MRPLKRTRQPAPKDGVNREERRAKRGWHARGGHGSRHPNIVAVHEQMARHEARAKRRRAAGRWAA